MNEPKPCTECGVIHAKPNEHKFIYIDLDDTLNKRGLVDPITLEPLFDPIELTCGHTFSKASIEEAFRTKKECPMCRKRSLKFKETHTIIKNQLNDLEVKCPNQCDLKIERQFLKTHLLNCPNVKLSCLNKCDDKKCNFIGIKTEMDEHTKVCELRTITCNGEGKCSVYAFKLEEHNCFKDLIKKVSYVIQNTSQTHKLEIDSLKNAINKQEQIINQQKKRIEENTECIKKSQDELKLLQYQTSSQNSLLHSLKKNTEAQDTKYTFINKRLFALEYTTKRSTTLASTSLPLPSKSISKSASASASASSFTFSSLTKDVFGINSKPMFVPKTYSIEDNKDLTNDKDKDNKTETSLVENETTLSTNDRKRKAEDD